MKRVRAFLMALLIFAALQLPASAAENDWKGAAEGTAAYLVQTVSEPQCGNIGGDWAVMGLARSGCAVPEGYYDAYYASVEDHVAACGGVLNRKKYTEYSRTVIALTAIGRDPTDVGGYDLLMPLGDYEKTVWQGVNGPIWALLALDAGEYAVPQNPDAATQATRQLYVDDILNHQLADGGWTLGGEKNGGKPADPDMTGMALQALAKYREQEAVQAAVDRALNCLSAMQDTEGGYASWGTTNVESCAQVVVALCELGVPLDDARFVKNGCTLLDNLLSFRTANGGFVHVHGGDSGNNLMSTEQGFYALAAALRAENGQSSLYRMSDAAVPAAGGATPDGNGLPGRDPAVTVRPVTKPGTSFDDVDDDDPVTAIEALAAREIINGVGEGRFAPDRTMTRAEYAAITVKALGLTPDSAGAAAFDDVTAGSWYAPYVGTACRFGIINGRGNGVFDPAGTITKQEAAVMTVRAAALCGLDTAVSEAQVLDTLCVFGDYRKAAGWAKNALAFGYESGLLDADELNIEPEREILRGEVAEMLWRMLLRAKLM